MINFTNDFSIERFLKEWSGNRNGLYKDFPDLIGQKAAKLTTGYDWIFNSIQGEEKLVNILQVWVRDYNFHSITQKSVYTTSKLGRSMIFLVPSKNGKNIIPNYVKNPFDERTAKFNEIDQSAEIWFRNSQSDSTQLSKITFHKNKITVETYVSMPLRTGTSETEPNENLQLADHYEFKNELGFVPFFEMENLIVPNIWNSTMGNFRPDWLPIANIIIGYNEAYRISQVELNANRSRYFGELTPDKIKKLKENGNYYGEDIMGDAFINAKFSNDYAQAQTGAGIVVVQGDPKLQSYSDYLKFSEEQIFNGSGYSPFRSSDGSGQYQNKTTALFIDKLDKETTDFKQTLLKPQLYKIFDCVLSFYGENPYDENGNRKYSFEFINLAITDSVQQIDDNVKLLNAGVISQSEFRSKVLSIPLNIAKEQMKEINKENKEYKDMFKPELDTNQTKIGKKETLGNNLNGGK